MRHIQKNSEPAALTEWKAQYGGDPNYGYKLMRQDKSVCAAVEQSLLDEQGRLDAYTEQRISQNSSHIEHLSPQTHCTVNEEVDYLHNLVACYPAPNRDARVEYGAEEKGKWPPPANTHLFVSPLNSSCETRFRYKRSGEVEPSSDDDVAAKTTIEKLNLNHPTLKEYRRSAIRTVRRLSRREARVRLRTLQNEAGPKRTPFGSALAQALEHHIQRMRYINQS